MADRNAPLIGDLSAAEAAAAALAEELKIVQAEEANAVKGMDDLALETAAAGQKNAQRIAPQLTVTDGTTAELRARQLITKELTAQTAQLEAQAVAAERIAVAGGKTLPARNALGQFTSTSSGPTAAASEAELGAVIAANRRAQAQALAGAVSGGGGRFPPPTLIAPGGAGGGEGGGSGEADADYARRLQTAQQMEERQVLSSQEAAKAWTGANVALTSYDNGLTKHGYLTSETIQAAQRGELTYAEWGSQIAGTAAKFAAWTAVSIPIFGALDAFKQLYDGAVQGSQGIAFIQRSINDLDTTKASAQIEALSQHFNVSIEDASQAMGIMARIYPKQNEAAQAAQAPLFAEKLGDLDINTAATRFNAIANAFHQPASDLVNIYDQVAQAQRKFGTSVDVSTQALASAGGAWHAAGGNLSQLLQLIIAINRTTNASGSQIATLVTQGPAQLIKTPTITQALQGLDINPFQAYPKIIEDVFKKAQEDPQNISALAAALGSVRYTRLLPAALANPNIYNRAGQETSASASQGVGQYELTRMLAGAGQQIDRIGVLLQNMGNGLAHSGALDSLGLMLQFLNHSLVAVNDLISAFDQIPGPIRTAVTVGGELYLGMKALAALNVGQGLGARGVLENEDTGSLTARGYLHRWLTPNQDQLTSKTAVAQFRANTDSAQEDARAAQARVREAAARQEYSSTRLQNLYQAPASQGGLGAAPGEKLSADEVATRMGALSEVEQANLVVNQQIAAADSKSLIAAVAEADFRDQKLFAMKNQLRDINSAGSAEEKLAIAQSGAYGLQDRAAALPHIGSGETIALPGSSTAENSLTHVSVDAIAKNNITGRTLPETPETTSGAPLVMAAGASTAATAESAAFAATEQQSLMSKLWQSPGTLSELQLTSMFPSMGRGPSAGLMQSGFQYLIGSMAAQMLGGAVGGSAGKTVTGVGEFAAGGAALGSLIPGLGPALGAAVGASLKGVIDIFDAGQREQAAQMAAISNPSTTPAARDNAARVAAEVAPGGSRVPNAQPFNSGPLNNAYDFYTGTDPGVSQEGQQYLNLQKTIQDAQAKAIAAHPLTPAPYQYTSNLVEEGTKQLAQAKTNAERVKILAEFTKAIDDSYEALTGNNAAVDTGVAALAGQATVANAPTNFLTYYKALGTGQTQYDQYLKDYLGQQGLNAKGPDNESLMKQAIEAAQQNEDRAITQQNLSQKPGLSGGEARSKQLVISADNYANQAHSLTQTILDQNTTDLANALSEATDVQGIQAAFNQAEANARATLKVDPQKGAAELRTIALQANQTFSQLAQAQLSEFTSAAPGTVAAAKATIGVDATTVLSDIIDKVGPQQMAQDLASSQAANVALYQAQQTQITNAGNLAASMQGNYTPGVDQAKVSAAQDAINALKSSGLSSAYKQSQLPSLLAQLKEAQLTAYNDLTQWTNDQTSALISYASDATNNPMQIAQGNVKKMQAIVDEGRFKSNADRVTALDNLRQAKFSADDTAFSQLQINLDLSHASIGQQIVAIEQFIEKHKKDVALVQTAEQQLISDQQSAASSYELNVGNVQLPTQYQVRRFEHALGKPHDQQNIMVHVPITVQGGHSPAKVAHDISRHIQKAVTTALRASDRSRVIR